MIVAAGLLFLCQEDQTILLFKRSKLVDDPGTWGIPGGSLHENEDPLTGAIREAQEELKSLPDLSNLLDQIEFNNYQTFIYNLSLNDKKNFKPQLNWEHDAYQWFPYSAFPANLHYGVEFIKNYLQNKNILPPDLQGNYLDWLLLEIHKLPISLSRKKEIINNINNTKDIYVRDIDLKSVLAPLRNEIIETKNVDLYKKYNYLVNREKIWNQGDFNKPKHEKSEIVDYLYHGTSLNDLISLIKTKTFYKTSSFDRVSFTTDLGSATKFGDAVLVFDGKRLQRKGAKKMKYVPEKQYTEIMTKDYQKHNEDGKNPKILDIYAPEREWFIFLPFTFSDDDLIKIIITSDSKNIDSRKRIKGLLEQIFYKPIEIMGAPSYGSTSAPTPEEQVKFTDLRVNIAGKVANYTGQLVQIIRKTIELALDPIRKKHPDITKFSDLKWFLPSNLREEFEIYNAIYLEIQDIQNLFRDTSYKYWDVDKFADFKHNLEYRKNKIDNPKVVEIIDNLIQGLSDTINNFTEEFANKEEDIINILTKGYSKNYYPLAIKHFNENPDKLIKFIEENNLSRDNTYEKKASWISTILQRINDVNKIPVAIWRKFPIDLFDNENFYKFPKSKYKEVFQGSYDYFFGKENVEKFIKKNRIPYMTNQANITAALNLLDVLTE